MGKGDKKSKRGKIIMGSYGVRRPRNKAKADVIVVEKPKKVKTVEKKEAKAPKASAAKTTAKKTAAKETTAKKTTKAKEPKESTEKE